MLDVPLAVPAVAIGEQPIIDPFEEEAYRVAVDAVHAATAIYTAPAVVDRLLDRLDWPDGGRRLLDPSCGDGMFLGRALERLLAIGASAPGDLLSRLEGWELHPVACAHARARLTAILEAHGHVRSEAAAISSGLVHNRDFLTEGPTTPQFDLIAGNPPYLRAVNVPALLQAAYAPHVPRYAGKDLLHAFLDRCTKALRADGQIALVTADRWLFNSGAADLRLQLGQSVAIRHLERLDPSSSFYRPKYRRAGSPPRIHPVAVVLGNKSHGRPLGREAVYPDVDPEKYARFPTLEEIAEVRIAPWLGTLGIFVVGRDVAQTLPAEYLVPAVDTDDIANGILREPSRFAILTRPDEEPPEAIKIHLETHMPKMAERGRRGKPWMPPESFHRFALDSPSLIVPRIATGPKGVRVPAGVLPINHNLSIVSAAPHTLDDVERALLSETAHQWVREHAAPLEGGYFSLTTTLLRKLPIDLS
jgi:hypothetical protein